VAGSEGQTACCSCEERQILHLERFKALAPKVSSADPVEAEHFPGDPRTVPRGSVDTFL
jgi:hypothetical protein